MPEHSRPHGIYLADGTFHSFDAESLSTELATRQRAGDFFAMVSGGLGVLPDPDPILRARGDHAAILADLAADDQVTTAMLNRKNRVLNQQDYAFGPGAPKDGEADGPAQLLCARLIQDMERWTFTDILAGLLDAPFYGFTPLELIWRAEGGGAASPGWWHLADVIPRPWKWFGYNADNAPVWRGSHGLCGANMGTAEALPPGKFVFARHFPSYENPYGLRLLSRCLWPVAFKKGGIQFYVNFVEKYGTPWAVGMAPAKATRQEKRDMAQDLSRMVQDAVAVIPAGSTVQLHTVAGQVGDLHERFLRRWDSAISKVLMGQTLTAELDGKGSYAAAETHMDVADDIAQADRRLVESALNEIAWLYSQVNDPTALAPVFAYAEKENLEQRADLDEKLSRVGVRFKPAHFERVYKLDPAEFEVTQPAQAALASPNLYGGFSFSASAKSPQAAAIHAQRAVDGAIAEAMPTALEASGDFCSQIEKELAGAESWEDARVLLAGGMKAKPEAMQKALANLMLGGAVFGSAAVQAEQGDG